MNQTGRSPPDGAGERTSDEIDAAHALQGMKRKGDEHSGDVTPDKRIKMETDDDVIDPNSYQPTRIILSSEAFSLFQGSRASIYPQSSVLVRDSQTRSGPNSNPGLAIPNLIISFANRTRTINEFIKVPPS